MNDLKFRLMVLLGAAWRQRYIIAIPLLILPIIGGIIGSLAPPRYQAHTSMLIQETAKMNPFLEDLAVSTMLNDRMNALTTLLKSRHVLKSVAESRGLITPEMSERDAESVIRSLSSNISISQLGKDFIKIELSANKPEGMKETLQAVSDQFIEQLLAPERSSIRDSSDFLTIHIEQRKQELELAESALAQFRNKHISSTPEMQTQVLNQLASLKQTLSEKEAELAGVEKSLGSLDQQLSKTNPVVGKIEEQIIAIRSELTLLQARYTDSHSAVQAKKRELDRLEAERHQMLQQEKKLMSSDQLWDMASRLPGAEKGEVQPLLITQLQNLQTTRGRYEALTEETRSLRTMIIQLEQQAYSFGDDAKQLQTLQREADMKRQLYDQLMERYEMAQLTGSLGIFEQNKRVKIIDIPYTPATTANLPVWVFVLAGWFAGVFLGSGLAIIFELFDTTIRRQDELERITKVPVLTVLPRIRS
ncbi:chain-length determining protein [Vibrio mimicus]|uniref:GumC family protein n=1 Tax=Vibrio mimicus TaxID=674 RepID=UPI0003B1948C|nr:Wzz/FepE/Etk N-terminal domain-containing protein [Vibrio mimicus]ERM55899.1 chain-length determining protein [Vibrio mimicus CAIM 1883]ERM56029.1 chain-length determining protein [Vibrio mimicus CAIM 1882]TXY29277.1 chain-length determining protein [Vibrio mimicus]